MWTDVVTRASACALVLLLLLCNTSVHCCGPGRGGTRRRSTRKLMPLIFKEHVPNVYENTLGASGLTEGAISRNSRRFQELVPNYNPDIIFRDEEGTGADRLMTERCKERLDTLAISVMNQWPGVRLRVKEAWEEDTTRHNTHSLHYEGRAVDIATSDSDRSKYGMLGRLAVEAGFDWVYYEARSHIHCSVKSESPALNRLGGCFPGTSSVLTTDGLRPVSSLRPGQMVQVVHQDGSTGFSPILMMLHADRGQSASFLHLTTNSGRTLSITSSHLLMRIPKDASRNLGVGPKKLLGGGVTAAFAGEVMEGDHVLVVGRNNSEMILEEVLRVRGGDQMGVFAPLTPQGNMVVDGVMVSCYAVINSQALAHWAFMPVRAYYSAKRIILTALTSLGLVAREDGRVDSSSSLMQASALTGEQRVMKLNAEWNSLLPNRTTNTVNTKLSYSLNVDLMNNNVTLSSSIKPESEGREATNPDTVEIHWYPRLLYSIARLILPKDWIAS